MNQKEKNRKREIHIQSHKKKKSEMKKILSSILKKNCMFISFESLISFFFVFCVYDEMKP